MKMTRVLATAAFATFLVSAGARAQTTILVPADRATIQAGIDAAVNGDTVSIAADTYLEHNIDLHGKAITVRGAGSATTVVDAQQLGRGFVVLSGALLQGLTIRNGKAADGGG